MKDQTKMILQSENCLMNYRINEQHKE